EGYAPLTVQFNDSSENADSCNWDFDNDGNVDSTEENPVHTFESAGNYTVNLTVSNEEGTDSKSATTRVLDDSEPLLPVADFETNVSRGNAPLTVRFTDCSIYATEVSWDFDNDGVIDSNSLTPVYTYTTPGTYTVNLTAFNKDGQNSKFATITVSEEPELPVADFETNVSEGYAPLSVRFTDCSVHATGVNWDFNNDGVIDSTSRTPVYTFTSAGTYTVSLTAINEDRRASKTATINVYEKSSSGGGSGGSGGGGGSPEPATNVQVKEISQAYISNGKSAKFDFSRQATCVMYVSFDSKKSAGKTTSSVEMLKGKSTLVSELPSGEVYKSFNIWVGNAGFATSGNIENSVICFKVEKSWIQDKKIDPATINLYRYNNNKWNKLETSLLEEDDKYLYFAAKTPGFSPFAIGGESAPKTGNENMSNNGTQQSGENITPGVEQKTPTEKGTGTTGKTRTPGFEIVYGIISLCTLLLYKKTRPN
ncbi:MAG TPA: PGF-pre-PGF domain-containing protein, partial [Methanosarcina sp.]|nr:PGF-pre-PGF domain-containing protein [Methanosarcina sp.]